MAVKNRQPIRTYDATYALATKSADDLLHGEPILHYDYSQVADEHRADVIARAKNIKRHERRTVESMLIIGRELMAVQDKLPHGHFLPWIEQEFGWQRSTAYNLINLAAKFPTVGNLPPGIGLSALYQLTAAPDSALAEAKARQANGESITKAKAAQIASRHRMAERKAEPSPPQDLSGAEAIALIWRAIKQHCPAGNNDRKQQHLARLHWLQHAPFQLFKDLLPPNAHLLDATFVAAVAAVSTELHETMARLEQLEARKATVPPALTTNAGSMPAATPSSNRIAKLVLIHKLRLARPYLLEARESALAALGHAMPVEQLLHALDSFIKSLEGGDGGVAGLHTPSHINKEES